MISRNFSLYELERILRIIRKWTLLCIFLIGGGIAYFIGFQDKVQETKDEIFFAPIKKSSPIASVEIHDELFSGGAALSLLSIPDLSKQLMYFGTNLRPDFREDDTSMFLYSPSSGEKFITSSETASYLSYGEKRGLMFSQEITPLMIKPSLLSDGRVKLQALLRFFSEDGDVFVKEEETFFLSSSSPAEKHTAYREEQKDHPAFALLASAIVWEPDKLFDLSDEEIFLSRRGKHRLELRSEKEKTILFMKERDLMVFKEGRWKEVCPNEETRGFPLAAVKCVSPHRLDLDVWDEQGFSNMNVSLTLHKVSPPNIRIEEMFSRIRRRTALTVSLKLNAKSMFLRKGDWLVQDHAGWKHVRSESEKQSIINYENNSELFVFEGLEKDDQAMWFQGFLFDSMRNSNIQVRLPLASSKKSSSPKKTALEEKFKKALSPSHE